MRQAIFDGQINGWFRLGKNSNSFASSESPQQRKSLVSFIKKFEDSFVDARQVECLRQLDRFQIYGRVYVWPANRKDSVAADVATDSDLVAS